MRTFSVLYYTKDRTKFQDFVESSKNSLKTASNRFTEIKILASFKGIIPLFPHISNLSQYLEYYNENLSDLTVVFDTDHIKKSPALLRVLMIEYPEVKFLFDNDNPKRVIFSGEAMASDLEEESLDDCENCLTILNDSIDKTSDIIKDSFLNNLKNDNSTIWTKIRNLLKIVDVNNINTEKLIKTIRDKKCEVLRTCAVKHVDDNLLKLPNIHEDDFFLNIIHHQDDLFDASNVRYAIKQWQYAHLRVNTQNFYLIQKSRRENLALSIEEENSQNRFNSYCLYANGYRVLPVTSASELKIIGGRLSEENGVKASLVVRDYDLQFYDTTMINSLCRFCSQCWNFSCMQEDPKEETKNSINLIRGFRDMDSGLFWTIHLIDSPCWKKFYSKDKTVDGGSIQRLYQIKGKDNELINNDPPITIKDECQVETSDKTSIPIYFISKGTDKVRLVHPAQFLEIDNNHSLSKRIACQFKKEKGFLKLLLPGIHKPVSGVYCPFQQIPEVKMRYRYINKNGNNKIDTTREGHDHGTALDVYATVKSLLRRSEQYYERGKYVHAAVLANETIEYLNGFHEALLLQAYQILAISENALSMDTVGGDEETLKADSLFRIEKINHEIDRILRRTKTEVNENEDRREFKYNILNQIYSKCRKVCKEKEHFKAENCFISAMAHVNDGYTPRDIWCELKLIRKRIVDSWKAKKKDISIIDYA